MCDVTKATLVRIWTFDSLGFFKKKNRPLYQVFSNDCSSWFLLQSEKIKYAYEVMQQYAHGIEYIIQDQIATGNKEFVGKFTEVRTFLKAVSFILKLCI